MKRDIGLGEINRFRDMYAIAQIRGDDGAGIMAVPRVAVGKDVPTNGKHGVKVARTTWSSGHLVTTKEFYDAIKGDQSILVGHARQPTRGGSVIDMVHPHRAGHIIMVHNGTMTYVNGNTLKPGESDSKAICRALCDKGPQEFVNNSYGAYALVWIDLEKQTLNFLRNGDRPLWMGEEKDTMINGQVTTLWWASESWMVGVPLSRYPAYNKEKLRLFQLPVNEHWSYPLDVDFFLKEAKIEKCEKKYVQSSYYNTYSGYDSWENDFVDPPFDVGTGGAGGTTNGKTSVIHLPTNMGTSTKKDQFKYIPPEQRGGERGEEIVTPTLSPGSVLKNSKANADMASAATLASGKGVNQPQADYFRKELSFFQCKNYSEAVELVHQGPCCWCNTSPTIPNDTCPKIYPVRWSSNSRDYICHECLKDEDAQRMLGVG